MRGKRKNRGAPIVDRVARTMTCRTCGEIAPWPMSAATAIEWSKTHSECDRKSVGR